MEYRQIEDLQTRINNIKFVLGAEPVSLKSSQEGQKKTVVPSQEMSTIEAYKVMQKKLQEKGVEQHTDFVTQVIETQKILEEQQGIQELCLSMNEKANIILSQAPKIGQNVENLKQIEQMKRYLDFAPVIDQKQKVQQLVPLDENFLKHASASQSNSDRLDCFLKTNNQVISDLNLRFVNIQNKLASLEKKS